MPQSIHLTEAVAVILEAAERPMTITELCMECRPYVGDLVSYFEVKQACVYLFQMKRVSLESSEPLTFGWFK